MNTQEMHIEVMQGVQKIAANRTRKLFPEEIDLRLNNMVEKLVTSAITENRYGYYEINERYAQALAPLKEIDINIPAYVVGTNQYKVLMPADFRYMVSPGTVVGMACENPGPADITTTTFNNVLYGWDLRSLKAVGTPPYWQTFSFTAGGKNLSNTNFVGWTGYQTKEELFQFANFLQEILWSLGVNAYFEAYDDVYQPGILLIPGTTAAITGFFIDGIAVTPQTIQTVSTSIKLPTNMKTTPARITRGSVSHSMRTTPYYATTGESPLLEEYGLGLFKVYADATFTVRGLEATYLRKPRKIDINLQRGCDLHPAYHKLLCNMAVEDILNLIGSPQWQPKVQQDNLPQIL